MIKILKKECLKPYVLAIKVTERKIEVGLNVKKSKKKYKTLMPHEVMNLHLDFLDEGKPYVLFSSNITIDRRKVSNIDSVLFFSEQEDWYVMCRSVETCYQGNEYFIPDIADDSNQPELFRNETAKSWFILRNYQQIDKEDLKKLFLINEEFTEENSLYNLICNKKRKRYSMVYCNEETLNYPDDKQSQNDKTKERNITVKLSDADCERLVRKCGEHGLTVGELIENFVGDLICGTYSNGSDERMYANQWFERCWFGMFPEPTLLNHLLCNWYDPEEYLDTLDKIETAIKEKEYLAEHPEEANEEAQYIDDDIADWEEELKDMRTDWKSETEPNMEEELERIKRWVDEKERLRN